jgi:excisionase family DNA binding protein
MDERPPIGSATSEPLPCALAIEDRTAPVDDERKATGSAKHAPDKSPRPPPLPANIALAYRVNDAAEVSGLSRSTIYNLIAEHKLRSIMVAGRRLIPADALRELLKGEA